jgi:hypothetical protein
LSNAVRVGGVMGRVGMAEFLLTSSAFAAGGTYER